ncbi:MAG: hypothetical protein LBG80_09455 [Bacteroidales bacterium]|nr:hypothetical protein [Bacteroidales bacterium]
MNPEEAEELFSEETLETMGTNPIVEDESADEVNVYCPQCNQCICVSTTTIVSTTSPSGETNGQCHSQCSCSGGTPPSGFTNGHCHQCGIGCSRFSSETPNI